MRSPGRHSVTRERGAAGGRGGTCRYLDQQMVDTIYRHMGITLAPDEDQVDEDIANMSGED